MFKKIIKIINPITSSQRQTILLKKSFLNKKFKIKKLIKNLKKFNGRNNLGKITVQHKGGGHKRLYRLINFNRSFNIEGYVSKILYDPNRSANIALIKKNFINNFIIAPEGLFIGQYIKSSINADLNIGNALPLYKITIGTLIHNISLFPKTKGKLIRSAGTYAQLIEKVNTKYARIRLSSGEFKIILLSCYVTIGIVSNINYKIIKKGKAGRSRWLNKRPTVRGVAKNPVDHPHGGGEGKTSGGRPSVTPQGKLTKGLPTKKKFLFKLKIK